jgi:hypothetical protein
MQPIDTSSSPSSRVVRIQKNQIAREVGCFEAIRNGSEVVELPMEPADSTNKTANESYLGTKDFKITGLSGQIQLQDLKKYRVDRILDNGYAWVSEIRWMRKRTPFGEREEIDYGRPVLKSVKRLDFYRGKIEGRTDWDGEREFGEVKLKGDGCKGWIVGVFNRRGFVFSQKAGMSGDRLCKQGFRFLNYRSADKLAEYDLTK